MPANKSGYEPGSYVVIACFTFGVSPVQAHTLSITQGELAVTQDQIRIELNVPAEDFLHLYPMSGNLSPIPTAYFEQSADQFRTDLLLGLHAWDDVGERLRFQIEGPTWSVPTKGAVDETAIRRLRAQYRLHADLNAAPSYVTFRQTIGRSASALRSQYVLGVRVGEAPPNCTLQLTNSGNVETLHVTWPPSEASSPPTVKVVQRLKRIQVAIVAESGELSLDIEVPLTLLETWRPVRRGNPDLLSPEEQRAAIAECRAVFLEAASITVDQRTQDPADVSLLFLAPGCAMNADDPAPAILSAWSARLACRLTYPLPSQLDLLDIEWRFFNNAVHLAEASIRIEGDAVENSFTTYHPKFRWRRSIKAE